MPAKERPVEAAGLDGSRSAKTAFGSDLKAAGNQ
jgi:hypothetical protein